MERERAPGREDAVREHHIFWMLVKAQKEHPVGRVYLAIQAALAYGAATVNVGWLTGEMMAQGQRTMNADGESIGAGGLAYFSWLYEVELVTAGEADRHEYCFRRRTDGKKVLATLRTADAPRSLHFQQARERERRRLEKQREKLLVSYRPPAPMRQGSGEWRAGL